MNRLASQSRASGRPRAPHPDACFCHFKREKQHVNPFLISPQSLFHAAGPVSPTDEAAEKWLPEIEGPEERSDSCGMRKTSVQTKKKKLQREGFS